MSLRDIGDFKSCLKLLVLQGDKRLNFSNFTERCQKKTGTYLKPTNELFLIIEICGCRNKM